MVVLIPEELASLGARQFGVLSRPQALDVWTAGQLARRLARGVVLPFARNVYRFPGTSASWRQRAMAATLSIGPPVAVCGLAAAYLWQVDQLGAPEVTVAVDRRRSGRSSVCRVVRRPVPATDVVTRWGIPVTTPARTVIDLSCLLSDRRLGDVLDDLIRRRYLDLPAMQARLHAAEDVGKHRLGALTRLCAARQADPRRGASPAEDWVWDTIAGAGLPLPVRHHPVWTGGRWIELDFAYPEPKVALEYDSAEFHRDIRRFHGDRRRAADLALDGWLLLSITAEWSAGDLVRRLGQALAQHGLH